MLEIVRRIYHRMRKPFVQRKNDKAFFKEFNRSNPLGGNGERVDIQLNKDVEFSSMDEFQKNHWKRYYYAKELINEGETCGDFACGTGYGSILLSSKAKEVVGADINEKVITAIRDRYKNNIKVLFLHKDLLKLSYVNFFDTIVSFETLEHFKEPDVLKLLSIFNTALKINGRLIFSTPYMQERSKAAIKMGFHQTFYIDEFKLQDWFEKTGFEIASIKFQNYDTHNIEANLERKDFIIGMARKVK